MTLALQQQASAQKQVDLALNQQEAAAVTAVAEGFLSLLQKGCRSPFPL